MKFKFRTIVNRNEDRVYSLALYLLRDSSEAEDIAQEAFLKLWKNIDSVEIDRAQSWLLKVTRNCCIDRIRQRRLNSVSIQVDDELNDDSSEPGKILAQNQLSEWLQAAIRKIQEPYRSLLVMRDLQQKSYSDLAQQLSLSSSQVKVYLHRARQQLKDHLQEIEL